MFFKNISTFKKNHRPIQHTFHIGAVRRGEQGHGHEADQLSGQCEGHHLSLPA